MASPTQPSEGSQPKNTINRGLLMASSDPDVIMI